MKSKLAVVDARCGKEILDRLALFAEEVHPFQTEGITYESISCHPDIFLYQDPQTIIVAPNAPQELFKKLYQLNISHKIGTSEVGSLLNNSCYYNCVATQHHLFHRENFTDPLIREANQGKVFVALPQSYTRCSLLALNDHAFATSDRGIEKQLNLHGFETFFFTPEEIKIAVHRYGFLGGTCGKWEEKILFLGNPLTHPDGAGLCHFIEKNNLEVVSLCNGHLYDGGGLFFLP
ncbi:MAG: hypothetical protein J6Y37_11880 [Paludibacteraceae bacterium]|nr:hypothetical protein [Paludibacteraceae bacterium]